MNSCFSCVRVHSPSRSKVRSGQGTSGNEERSGQDAFGNKDRSGEDTSENEEKSVQNTFGNKDRPGEDTSGNADRSGQDAFGNKDRSGEDTSENEEKSVQNTFGNKDRPGEDTSGNADRSGKDTSGNAKISGQNKSEKDKKPGQDVSGIKDSSSQDTSGNDHARYIHVMLDRKLNTWEKVENEINSLFTIVRNADSKTTNLTKPLSELLVICQHLFMRGKVDLVKMGDYMVTLELIQTLASFLETGIQSVDCANSLLTNNLILFLQLILCLTDVSENVCKSVVSNGLHTKLIDILRADLEGKLTIRPVKQVEVSFSILYNTLRSFPDSKVKLREAGVVDICSKYLATKQLLIKTLALLVLLFAADLDRSAEIIQASESNLRFLIRCLKEALDSPGKRDKEGFHLEELLECMSKLAMNKTNALEMVKLDILQHCLSVLDEKQYSVEEMKWALMLIWSLSFADENQSAIYSSGIVSLLTKKLEHHENREISEPAKSILWELKVKKPDFTPIGSKSDQSTKEAKEKGHIMISYCWKKEGEKEKARQIFRRLKDSGEKVWIDIERMQGDSLQAMAEAVENADAVICCFSEDYSQSQPCRREAEYASQLQKKIVFAKMQADYEPKGWLGFISVAHIYYKFYDKEIFEEQFMQMMKYIKSNSDDHVDAPTQPQLATCSEPNRTTFKCWTVNETSDWLKTVDLTKKATVMLSSKGLDGKALFQLRRWQKTAPEFFLGFCQNSLKIQDPMDLLKFTAAIENLESQGA